VKAERVVSEREEDNRSLFCTLLRKEHGGCKMGACRSLGLLEETPPVDKRKADASVLAQTKKEG
jgi:hypothetical protein